jgi:hypothetical protein
VLYKAAEKVNTKRVVQGSRKIEKKGSEFMKFREVLVATKGDCVYTYISPEW